MRLNFQSAQNVINQCEVLLTLLLFAKKTDKTLKLTIQIQGLVKSLVQQIQYKHILFKI